MAGSKIRLYGSTSGYVELEAPAVSPDASLVLPSTFAGIGSNVVQTVKTDTFTNAFVLGAGIATVDVTGLSVTITPTSATSKVLVLATVSGSNSARNGIIDIRLVRDGGTVVGAVGDASGSRYRISHRQSAIGQSGSDIALATLTYLDSPATTSATTYQISVAATDDNANQTVYVNRSSTDADNFDDRRTISTITAIEVAA